VLSQADDRAIDQIVERLRSARRLLFITGAGLSADSGLPTYRGRDGLYRIDRTTPHGLPIEMALSGPMFEVQPEITWYYLLELERSTRGAVPNRGHHVIAEMENYFDSVWTVTQNVDGLHGQAGSRQVLDLHGNLRDLRCTECDYTVTVPDYAGLTLPPSCPQCQGLLRPTVVLFGEQLPEDKVARLWYEFGLGFDVVFSVGTSSLFEYIAAPVELAQAAGITTVEINPETTRVTPKVEFKISGGAASVLDLLWERYLVGWPWS
jgi:NAD-dependent deacetylase